MWATISDSCLYSSTFCLTYEEYQNTSFSLTRMGCLIFPEFTHSDYEYVRNHLAKIMIQNAAVDKKREPEHVAIYHLAWLIARLVLDFALNPELEEHYTAKGRLAYAGLKSHQMSTECYRKTWKPYENLMTMAIESAIDEAGKAVEAYKRNTYKDMKA